MHLEKISDGSPRTSQDCFHGLFINKQLKLNLKFRGSLKISVVTRLSDKLHGQGHRRKIAGGVPAGTLRTIFCRERRP